MCEQPYLKQGHVLLVVLLALLGGGIAAVDEGAALLRVTVTCEKQTPSVRRLTPDHVWFFTSVLRLQWDTYHTYDEQRHSARQLLVFFPFKKHWVG